MIFFSPLYHQYNTLHHFYKSLLIIKLGSLWYLLSNLCNHWLKIFEGTFKLSGLLEDENEHIKLYRSFAIYFAYRYLSSERFKFRFAISFNDDNEIPIWISDIFVISFLDVQLVLMIDDGFSGVIAPSISQFENGGSA